LKMQGVLDHAFDCSFTATRLCSDSLVSTQCHRRLRQIMNPVERFVMELPLLPNP